MVAKPSNFIIKTIHDVQTKEADISENYNMCLTVCVTLNIQKDHETVDFAFPRAFLVELFSAGKTVNFGRSTNEPSMPEPS